MTASERGRMIWKLADLLEAAHRRIRDTSRASTTASLSPSRAPPTFRWPSTCSATWRAGRQRSKATRFRSPFPTRRAPSISPTRCASRSAWQARSFPWNFPLLMAAWKLGPGAGLRLHRRVEARRANAALGAASRRTDHGSRLPRRRGQHRLRATAKQQAPRWPLIPTSTRSPSPVPPKSAS